MESSSGTIPTGAEQSIEKLAGADVEALDDAERQSRTRELVTPREIHSWWIFEGAVSGISSVAITTFLPILMESLAAKGGTYEGTGISCATDRESLPRELRQAPCVVGFMGAQVSHSSYVYYVSAVSVIVQALVFISCGSIADYGRYRKMLLVASATLSATGCLLVLLAYKPRTCETRC